VKKSVKGAQGAGNRVQTEVRGGRSGNSEGVRESRRQGVMGIGRWELALDGGLFPHPYVPMSKRHEEKNSLYLKDLIKFKTSSLQNIYR
jgi:hypothetical protein